jgi:hydroxyacylglutathione hydrolase
MQVHSLPVLNDNYAFLIQEEREVILIDPPLDLFSTLESQNLWPVAIFNTHHHYDHIGGNASLMQRYPHLSIFAGSYDIEKHRIPHATHSLKNNETLYFKNYIIKAYHAPGHTLGHMIYHFTHKILNIEHLFCGDILFGAGCGRILEGSFKEQAPLLLESLNLIQSFDETIPIWCAHEYTGKNIEFSLKMIPEDLALQKRKQTLSIPSVPLNLSVEKESNLFLRCSDPKLLDYFQKPDPLSLFSFLRESRNHY